MTPPIQQMLYAQVPKDPVVTFLDVSNRSGIRGVWGGGFYNSGFGGSGSHWVDELDYKTISTTAE